MQRIRKGRRLSRAEFMEAIRQAVKDLRADQVLKSRERQCEEKQGCLETPSVLERLLTDSHERMMAEMPNIVARLSLAPFRELKTPSERRRQLIKNAAEKAATERALKSKVAANS
jgi:hypothetical protein